MAGKLFFVAVNVFCRTPRNVAPTQSDLILRTYSKGADRKRSVDRYSRLCMKCVRGIRKAQDRNFNAAVNVLRLLAIDLKRT